MSSFRNNGAAATASQPHQTQAVVRQQSRALDGYNGLLLTPHIDHLFDRGYLSFEDDGRSSDGMLNSSPPAP
jgi:hypothetical protein